MGHASANIPWNSSKMATTDKHAAFENEAHLTHTWTHKQTLENKKKKNRNKNKNKNDMLLNQMHSKIL